MLRARSAKPSRRIRGGRGKRERKRERKGRKRSGWLGGARVQIHNMARRAAGQEEGKKGGRPLSSFRRKERRSLFLSLFLSTFFSFPLHLLKQYNNSFLSHPLSKTFYCDGSSLRELLEARRIVSPLAKLLSTAVDPFSASE